MAIPKQKFREVIFQLLYCKDIGQVGDDEVVPFLMQELSITRSVVRNALEEVKKILPLIPAIDGLIRETSQSYRFERIQSIEKNVLRLGVYELLHDESIPPKVAIAEAIRLAKKFSTPESATFVNAVLDAIFKKSKGESIDESKLKKSTEEWSQSENINAQLVQRILEEDKGNGLEP